jgi:DNA-binding CsgD family transcriptional regulator
MLSLMGFIILNRQKLKLKVRRQQALEEKRIAEQEAQSAKDQLDLFTRNLIDKNALIESLQQQLLQRDISEEQKSHIAALSGHTILTDEDWENFKILFEKVYPGFFYRLRQKVSDLTMSDLRIAALSKLQLSNKEAATLLGIAPNSVLKARQRLRQRLGLAPETDLEHYLAHSPEFQ